MISTNAFTPSITLKPSIPFFLLRKIEMKSVPPLEDLFKMAGMELPSYLKGKAAAEDQPVDEK